MDPKHMTSDSIAATLVEDPSKVKFVSRSMGPSIYDAVVEQLDASPFGGMVETETPSGTDIRRHQARVSSAMNPRLKKLGKDYRVRVRTSTSGVVVLVKVQVPDDEASEHATPAPKAKPAKAAKAAKGSKPAAKPRKKARK